LSPQEAPEEHDMARIDTAASTVTKSTRASSDGAAREAHLHWLVTGALLGAAAWALFGALIWLALGARWLAVVLALASVALVAVLVLSTVIVRRRARRAIPPQHRSTDEQRATLDRPVRPATDL
jgi:hypothetical protein